MCIGTAIEILMTMPKIEKDMETSKTVINLSGQSFEKVISNGIVLVDFWAEWCAPCRMQGPILNDVAVEVGDRALITKVNVDDNRQIAAKYGIQSIPSLYIFKDGVVVKKFVGVQQRQVLVSAVNGLISQN